MPRVASLSGTLALVIAVAGGCGNSSLQGNTDGGQGNTDGGQGNADGGQDGLPPLGRRSYTVHSTVTSQAQQPFSPGGHTFTLIIDGDTKTVIAGANGSGKVAPFSRASSDTIVTGAFGLDIGCDAAVSYDSLFITIGADGNVTGSGTGHGIMISGDVRSLLGSTMTLSGLPDTREPALGGIGLLDVIDPLARFSLVATEPLPPTARPVLVAASGAAAIALVPSPTEDGPAVNVFESPGTLLRYDERYVVQFAGTTDFAGNLTRMRDAAPVPDATGAAVDRGGRLRIGCRGDAGRGRRSSRPRMPRRSRAAAVSTSHRPGAGRVAGSRRSRFVSR